MLIRTPYRITANYLTSMVNGYCWGAAPRVSKNEVVTLCARHTALDAFSQLLFPRTKYYFNLLE
jgi:hypothetical protein